jgi:hypothetical protein
MSHIKSNTHKRAVEMRSDLDTEGEKSYEIGANMFRLVLQILREAVSRQDFEKKVADFHMMGIVSRGPTTPRSS